METSNGKLLFSAGIDTSQMKKDAQKVVDEIVNVVNVAEQQGDRMDQALVIDTTNIDRSAQTAINKINEVGAAAEAQRQRAQSAMSNMPSSSIDITSINSIKQIEEAFAQLDWVIKENSDAIAILEQELSRTDKSGSNGKQRVADIKAEISARKELISEAKSQISTLGKLEDKLKKSEAGHKSMRAQIMEAKMALMELQRQGKENTAEYQQQQQKLAELTKQWKGINAQAKNLSMIGGTFSGISQGLSAIAGAASMAQGAMSLFGDKNEDVQKAMQKVQVLMSVTMSLQQLSIIFNKNSAFQLNVVQKIRERYNASLAKSNMALQSNTAAEAENTAAETANTASTSANVATKTSDAASTEAEAIAKAKSTTATISNTTAETSNTIATGANTTAQNAQTAAATTGAVANKGLAGAFRMVGAAIKSIPVFGWIVAAISALIVVIKALTKETDETKIREAEVTEKMKEQANTVAEQIAAYEKLRSSWLKLKTAKEKTEFIKRNQSEFNKLNKEIKSVDDAEKYLVKNTTNVIRAMNLRAQAAAYMSYAVEQYAKVVELQINRAREAPGVWDTIKTQWSSVFSRGDIEKALIAEREKERERLKTYSTAPSNPEEYDKFKNQWLKDPSKAAKKSGMSDYEKAVERFEQKWGKGGIGSDDEKRRLGIMVTDRQFTTTPEYLLEAFNRQYEEQINKYTENAKAAISQSAKLQEEADKLDAPRLKDSNKTSHNTSKDYSADTKKQAAELATKLAEYNTKLENDITAADIEAMDEGAEKEIAQIKLNGVKKREEFEKTQSELGKKMKEVAHSMWREKNPKAKESVWLDSEAGKKSDLDYFKDWMNTKEDNAELQKSKDAVISKINTAYKQIEDAEKRAIEEVTRTQNNAIRQQKDAYLKEYAATTEEKIKAIEDDYDRQIEEATKKGDGWKVAELMKKKQEAVVDFEFKNFQKSPQYTDAFANLGNMPVGALKNLSTELDNYRQKAAEVWANEPERLREYMELIKQVKDAIYETENEWGQYADARREYYAELKAAKEANTDAERSEHINRAIKAYERMKTAEEKVREKAGKVASATLNITKRAQELAAVWSDDIADSIGIAVDTLEEVKDVAEQVTNAVNTLMTKTGTAIEATVNAVAIGTKTASNSASKSISTLEKASAVLAIIGAAIQLATLVAGFFDSDKKHEKNIENLQDQIDKLERYYHKLERSISDAYSVDASHLIEQQNTLLRQQQELIRMQIAEEEAKKKTDKDKIKEWRNQLDDITEQIEDNIKKAIDAITGSDLKSVIDSVADAWVNAWTDGVSAARSATDAIKKIMKQGLIEYLKKMVAPDLEKFYTKMATALADGTITTIEDSMLRRQLSDITAGAEQYWEQIKQYFDDDNDNSGGTRTAFEGMSQDTADELNGRFTALQIAGEAIRQQVTLIRAQMEESRTIALTSMSHLEDISRNTRELYTMNTRLANIERNTARI